mgnify:CR=1 FL=1
MFGVQKLSENIKKYRKKSGMKQFELAEKLYVTPQAVSKWESSRGYPEMEKIIYICNRYGATMDELFADEVPPRQAEKAYAVWQIYLEYL